MPNNTCEHCGGSQLISGLTVSASGGGGAKRKRKAFSNGPKGRNGRPFLLTCAPLAAL
jgi:hypothetical protein